MRHLLNLLTPLAAMAALPMYGQIALATEKVIVTNEWRVNSDELEFSPVFYKDGIVFITSRFETVHKNIKDKNFDNKNIFSIYRSQRDAEGFLGTPYPFANELIFRLHEGPLTFDRTAETIFFTRNEEKYVAPDGKKKLQIYQAKFNGIQWDSVAKLPFNDPNYNFLHPTISADNDLMIIASDMPGGYGGMDLYAVLPENGKWTKLVNLGGAVNSEGNEVFPYLAADGTLYFASDGHGGYGKLDLFYTTRRLGEWTAPVNLGVPFNSPKDDFGFIVDRDNRNGYFSSNRDGGFGEDDIYSFYIETGRQPVAATGRGLEDLVVRDEVGQPLSGATVTAINMDEVAVVVDDEGVVRLVPAPDDPQRFILDVNPEGLGNKGTTDDRGKADVPLGYGNHVVKIAKEGYLPEYIVVGPETDLSKMEVRLRPAVNCVPVSGVVFAGNRRTPIGGAAIKIVEASTGETITIYSDDKGFYEYCLPCNKLYTVYASRGESVSTPVAVTEGQTQCTKGNAIDLPLYLGAQPLYAGMTIVLPNIYFNFDDYKLRPDAYPDLDEVVTMMKTFPGMKVELASHTDSRGSKAYNLELSRKRSESVFQYLVSKGIDPGRLVPRGYGESQLRNHCADGVACSEAEHQFNRRTEIKILEIGPVEAPLEPSLIAESGEIGDETEKGGGLEPEVVPTSEVLPSVLSEAAAPAGTYAVIAGTFANLDNAQRRVQQLKALNFPNAVIVKQDRNGLYAVWASVAEHKSTAFGIVRQLSQHQISAYVRKR